MEITEELKEKTYECKAAEEPLALAAESGIVLFSEEAKLIL